MTKEQIVTIANYTSTPFYLYDLNVVKDKVKQIKDNLPNFNLLYSIKANPHYSIVNLFNRLGVGFDVASTNELRIALSEGCNPNNIYYSAPGKTVDDLRFSINKCHIIADSLNELHNINSIANSSGCTLKVGIRLNIQNERMCQSIHEVMSGFSSKFGMNIEECSVINKNNFPYLEINGVHIYFGSQLLDVDLICSNFHIIANQVLNLTKDYNIEFVNFGGGFGIPYEQSEQCIDMDQLSDLINEDSAIQKLFSTSIILNLELGRYLVAECGYFVSRIIDVKTSFNKKYAIIDGGMHAFYRPIMTGNFHDVIQFCSKGELESVTLVGRLCTPIDKYYDDFLLYPVSAGDLIVFRNAGAYGFSMSLLNFISYDKPTEIIIEGSL